MNFKISNIEHYASPAGLNVDEILKTYCTSLADIKKPGWIPYMFVTITQKGSRLNYMNNSGQY